MHKKVRKNYILHYTVHTQSHLLKSFSAVYSSKTNRTMATCNFGYSESGGQSLTISAILFSVLLRTASFSASIKELEYSRQAGFGFLDILLHKG